MYKVHIYTNLSFSLFFCFDFACKIYQISWCHNSFLLTKHPWFMAHWVTSKNASTTTIFENQINFVLFGVGCKTRGFIAKLHRETKYPRGQYTFIFKALLLLLLFTIYLIKYMEYSGYLSIRFCCIKYVSQTLHVCQFLFALVMEM